MRVKSALFVMVVSGVVAAGVAPLANAEAWGPITSSYNKVVRVSGSGSHYNDAGVNAANKMTVADKKDDGNSVYGKTEFLYWLPDNANVYSWKWAATKTTGEWANMQKTITVKTGLNAVAEKSRAVSKVCAQMGWPVPDSCGQAITSFVY